MEINENKELDGLRKLVEAELLEIRKNYDRKAAIENRHKKQILGFAAVSMLVAAASIGLNFYLFPLKQTEPIIAIVDAQTGIVTEVAHFDKDTDPKKLEPLVQSYAYSYVTGRYGYHFVGGERALEERYHKVSVFSGDVVNKAFLAEVSPTNPNSPFSLLEDKGRIEVKINSVTRLPDNRVQVDFRTILRQSQTERIYAYTAIGKYETGNYDGLTVEDRWMNPTGFKFVDWTVSQKASNDALAPNATVPGVAEDMIRAPASVPAGQASGA